MQIIPSSISYDRDRTSQFARFARRQAATDVLLPPTRLDKFERRLYVRETVREDHQFRIQNRPEGAQAKFDKMAKSVWNFFRATTLLFYRDMAGTDAEYPRVLANGDAHPENFGVMPNEDGAPFFGLNDFDEACCAPFTWDLKRATVGFYLAARVQNRKRKCCRASVRAFLDGYFDSLLQLVQNDADKSHQFRIDNSPPMIRNLLEAAQRSRRPFLAKMIDLKKGRFRATDKLVPHSKQIEAFQKIVREYCENNNVPNTPRAGHFRVKDVAIKKGSGTASLGLDRYFVLLDGPTDDHADDIVLEMKQARRPALLGLVPESTEDDVGEDAEAGRIVKSHAIHLVGGDPYYGRATIGGRSFLVRERSPFKEEIDSGELSHQQFLDYAGICGRTLAIAHARCDGDSGLQEDSLEVRILSSVRRELFCDDVVRFAERVTKRIQRDYKGFRKDLACGAFQFQASRDG